MILRMLKTWLARNPMHMIARSLLASRTDSKNLISLKFLMWVPIIVNSLPIERGKYITGKRCMINKKIWGKGLNNNHFTIVCSLFALLAARDSSKIYLIVTFNIFKHLQSMFYTVRKMSSQKQGCRVKLWIKIQD